MIRWIRSTAFTFIHIDIDKKDYEGMLKAGKGMIKNIWNNKSESKTSICN